MTELTGATEESISLGIRTFEGKFTFPSNDPTSERFGQETPIDVKLHIHPNSVSKRVIINVPGKNGDAGGYAGKYKNLAQYMQSSDLGAVIRTDNKEKDGFLPDINLRAALQYTRENAWATCGESEPDVLLMGISAGAGAIAAIAHEYPEVKRLLLFAPDIDMGEEAIREGLSKFTGEVYIVAGANDDVVTPETTRKIYDWATRASHKELVFIDNCDHLFTGEENGRKMSQAPLHAFATGEKPPEFDPNPNGGIKLYD